MLAIRASLLYFGLSCPSSTLLYGNGYLEGYTPCSLVREASKRAIRGPLRRPGQGHDKEDKSRQAGGETRQKADGPHNPQGEEDKTPAAKQGDTE